MTHQKHIPTTPANADEAGLREQCRYMGELMAAARHDIAQANPADVGMNGCSVVEWRKAYAEGVKDAAEGFVTRVPESIRDEAAAWVRAAYEEQFARLSEDKVETP